MDVGREWMGEPLPEKRRGFIGEPQLESGRSTRREGGRAGWDASSFLMIVADRGGNLIAICAS